MCIWRDAGKLSCLVGGLCSVSYLTEDKMY